MSDAKRFQVIFEGKLTDEFDPQTTRERMLRLLHIKDDDIARILEAPEYVLKKGLTEEAAMNYAVQVVDAGCECSIEEVEWKEPNQPAVNRRAGERRTRFRRSPRLDSSTKDRRISYDRRDSRPEKRVAHA